MMHPIVIYLSFLFILAAGQLLSQNALDGFKTTNDNVRGLLVIYLKDTGYSSVEITKNYNTIFGTLSLLKAIKSN